MKCSIIKNMNKKGFTLIELLTVIVILSILMVIVLNQINPIEQIKKAKDASKKVDAVELFKAYERYYTNYQKYPWQKIPNKVLANDELDGVQELIQKGEVKLEFEKRSNLESIYVTERDAGVYVCFRPESQFFLEGADYTADCDGTLAERKGEIGNCICSPE